MNEDEKRDILMNKKICKNCQYFREFLWCSNAKSPFFRMDVRPIDGCNEFYQRGKKAPGYLRVIKEILSWILRREKAINPGKNRPDKEIS